MLDFDLFFLTDADLLETDQIILKSREVHHINTVLRKRIGDHISVTDGKEKVYVCRIVQLDKKQIQLAIETQQLIKAIEKPIRLCNALLKGSTFDLQIEKAIELGVSEIQPIISEHIQANKSKLDKWRDIVLKASKQSKQFRFIPIQEPKKLKQLETTENELWIVPELIHDTVNLTATDFDSVKSIHIFIGPEGGFSKTEIEFFRAKRAKFISLGELRLRAETAAWSAIVHVKQLIKESR